MLLEQQSLGTPSSPIRFLLLIFVVGMWHTLGEHSTMELYFQPPVGLCTLPGPGTARGWLQVSHFVVLRSLSPDSLKLAFHQRQGFK